ncbi:YigZ family protein [Mycobacterium sp. ITM-2016-00317]|uniref:IMPACT family protein n=1 Tax=Mycobacterium sp. ITM-2016-00317 TaxID=2099694 RepID=UPI000D425C8B|nr:YigZ family protein [Mycobacterium sp. ITM-2016-00317]WNG87545.1 YigZ family protein [Mycobacterium sp. ITM-2016-00317]
MPFTLAGGDHPVAEALIKKSRFVARLRRVERVSDAVEFVAAIRQQDRGAGHHCFAYLVGADGDARVERSSDDGEPAGTAGVPILNTLKSHDLIDVVAVVSRHFGGIKLGAGGLARAYSGTVAAAVASAKLCPRVAWQVFRLAADHGEAGRVQAELRARGIEVVEVTYGERATITVMCAEAVRLQEMVDEITSGRAESVYVGRVWR